QVAGSNVQGHPSCRTSLARRTGVLPENEDVSPVRGQERIRVEGSRVDRGSRPDGFAPSELAADAVKNQRAAADLAVAGSALPNLDDVSVRQEPRDTGLRVGVGDLLPVAEL